MIKAVIFDLDGTLVNTISDLAASVEKALSEFGYPSHTTEEYTSYVGNGTYKLIERSLPADTDKNIVEAVHARFGEIYSQHYCDTSLPYEGITELLDLLVSRGAAICVNSNKPDTFTKEIIAKLFPMYTFDHVVGQRDDVPKKPDPASELDIISSLGLDGSEVLHIGDSDVDIFTAHNAGIKALGCAWGFRPKETLISAEYLADTPYEAKEILEKLLQF